MIKIFFDASLSGKKYYKEEYQAILSKLKHLGCSVVASPVIEGSASFVAQETEAEAERYYQNLMKWIGGADMAVFEVSHPSTGIGHEIAVALHKGKPVIALYTKEKRPYVLESITDEKLQVLEYHIDELDTLLRDALEYATEQQDVRFNFFVSPEIQHYLDWVAKFKRTPRAVYLRELLEKDMRENKEWKQQK